MSAPKPLGWYLDAYARAYRRASSVAQDSDLRPQIIEAADKAKRRLVDHVRSYGYVGPAQSHSEEGGA